MALDLFGMFRREPPDHAVEVMAEYFASDRQPVTADERVSLALLGHQLDRVEFVDSCLQDLPHRPDPA